jgi:hypothetical protein
VLITATFARGLVLLIPAAFRESRRLSGTLRSFLSDIDQLQHRRVQYAWWSRLALTYTMSLPDFHDEKVNFVIVEPWCPDERDTAFVQRK